MSGVFAVSRDVFDHPLFDDSEPFSEREAWLWLISEAAWKPGRVRVGNAIVNVDRGQLAHSVRFMADRWKWSKSRVDRFLDRLKTETMIGTDAGQGVTVITICKYDEYQKVSLPKKEESGTENGTAAGQQRDREENIESIERRNIPLRGASPEAELFSLGRQVLGKSAGGLVTKLRKATDYDDEQVRAILAQAGGKADPVEWVAAVIRRADNERTYGATLTPDRSVPKIKTKADREYEAWEAQYYATAI